MLKKWLFLNRSIGTTLSKEDTLDKATYPTAGDKVLKSKAKVTWSKSWPIILCTVEEYAGTNG